MINIPGKVVSLSDISHTCLSTQPAKKSGKGFIFVMLIFSTSLKTKPSSLLSQNSTFIEPSHTHHCISGSSFVCCHVSQAEALHLENASLNKSEKEDVDEVDTLLK